MCRMHRGTVIGLLVVLVAAQAAPPVAELEPKKEVVSPSAGIADPAPEVKSAPSNATQPDDGLLDESRLTFLVPCRNLTNGQSPQYVLCDAYRQMVERLPGRKVPGMQQQLLDELSSDVSQDYVEHFCEKLQDVGTAAQKNGTPVVAMWYCDRHCLTEVKTVLANVSSICRALLWGYRKTLVPPSAEKAANQVVLPGAVLPVPQGGKKADESPAQAPAAVVNGGKPNDQLPISHGRSNDTDAKSPPEPPVQERPAEVVKEVPPPQDEQSLEKKNDDIINSEVENNNNDEDEGTDANEHFEDDRVDEGLDEKDGDLVAAGDPNPIGTAQVVHPVEDADEDGRNGPKVEAVNDLMPDPFYEQTDSNFFSYFLFAMFSCIACYVAYHNRSKLLALVVEGRRTSNGRGGFSKGRKHTAAYRKLDSNLEEAITSGSAPAGRSTAQIIY